MQRFAFAIVALAGCHPSTTMSAQQIDDVHRDCQARIDKGTLDPSRSKRVGFLAERRPPGTPVVIYGASWCKACDAAASYLTRRGIPFVEKDVEEDAAARAKLDGTIAESGLAKADGLPVMDIRGTITLGFFPCVIDFAWSAP